MMPREPSIAESRGGAAVGAPELGGLPRSRETVLNTLSRWSRGPFGDSPAMSGWKYSNCSGADRCNRLIRIGRTPGWLRLAFSPGNAICGFRNALRLDDYTARWRLSPMGR